MRSIIYALLFIGFSWVSQAQTNSLDITSMSSVVVSNVAVSTAAVDSTQTTFSISQLVNMVLANHPVVQQAEMVREMANAELLSAKGNFDPKISAGYDLKNLKDTEYWDILNTTLKVPTWIPIDPKITFDRAQGDFLNPERFISPSSDYQQVTAGVAIPLGKGLFIDERRAVVKQARIYQNIATAEQTKMVNKILFTAIKDYWEWQLAYQEVLLLEQSVGIAQELYERLVLDFQFGEAAPVDTIQAMINYQTRQVEYEEVKFDYIKSQLRLAVHLWSVEGIPLGFQDGVVPDTLSTFGAIPTEEGLIDMVTWARVFHPEIQKLEGKGSQLEVEQRWNRETLKPQLDFNYSFIDAPITPQGESSTIDFNDNYKLGLDFSFPIFLRKERGKLQKTKLKIVSNDLELQRSKLAIENQLRTSYAELQMADRNARNYESMADNYNRLVQAELFNLETGESDLFKFNIQQDKYINSRLKFLKTQAKAQKLKAEILYEAGYPLLSPVN
ncbi:MAG: TolC family protein [Cytophagales bacterium]|nr:TolC family protein [Cytophagales bacterium]